MLCDECGQRPASVRITKVVNGQKAEMNLCEECAKVKGEFQLVLGPHVSITNMLSGLFGREPETSRGEIERCELCGMTFADFAKAGRLGCSACYARFEQRLDPVLRRIHGSHEHVGRAPKRLFGHINLKREIEQLRQELDKAVKAEAYETAAVLRDKIRELEKQGQSA
jgi:protein arginine kinase activator